LIRDEIRFDELRLVVEHFLEMRDVPLAVHGIAVEAAAEMVVDAAVRHFLECEGRHFNGAFAVLRVRPGAVGVVEEKNQFGGTREFWSRAETAFARIEAAFHLLESLGENGGAEVGVRARAGVGEVLELIGNLYGLCEDSLFIVRPGFRDAIEHREKSRTPEGIVRREVGAADKGLEVRREPHAHRPAASARGGLHEGHINAVHVGAFLAVHLDVHEMVVHEGSDFRVFKGFALHHMAPVAGRVADGEEDRLVFRAGLCERLFAPRIPVHRIVGVLEEIRRFFFREPVGVLRAFGGGFRCLCGEQTARLFQQRGRPSEFVSAHPFAHEQDDGKDSENGGEAEDEGFHKIYNWTKNRLASARSSSGETSPTST